MEKPSVEDAVAIALRRCPQRAARESDDAAECTLTIEVHDQFPVVVGLLELDASDGNLHGPTDIRLVDREVCAAVAAGIAHLQLGLGEALLVFGLEALDVEVQHPGGAAWTAGGVVSRPRQAQHRVAHTPIPLDQELPVPQVRLATATVDGRAIDPEILLHPTPSQTEREDEQGQCATHGPSISKVTSFFLYYVIIISFVNISFCGLTMPPFQHA